MAMGAEATETIRTDVLFEAREACYKVLISPLFSLLPQATSYLLHYMRDS